MPAILAGTSALVTSDAQHGQLADDVAECDRAVSGHHNHPSTRNARSICASLSRYPILSWSAPPSAATRPQNPSAVAIGATASLDRRSAPRPLTSPTQPLVLQSARSLALARASNRKPVPCPHSDSPERRNRGAMAPAQINPNGHPR